MPENHQYRYLSLLFITYIALGLLTRLILALSFQAGGSIPAWELARACLLGGLNDAAAFVYLGLGPAAIICLPCFNGSRYPGGAAKGAAFLLFAALLGFWLFVAAAEYFFWEEFGSRFNFIAVDYLIYTKVLLRNIIESYNLPLILTGIFMASLVLTRLILPGFFPKPAQGRAGARAEAEDAPDAGFWRRKKKTAYALTLAVWLAALAGLYLAYRPPAAFQNNLANELSYNGLYRLFSAYWNNQLDYRQFYPVMAEGEALAIMRDELSQPGHIWDGRPGSLARRVRHQVLERRLNVIQVVVESLGSDLLGEDTPNLNKLIEESLYFENLRATGTRTVRGLEALTLGVPPTPGSSIVRRPGHGGLFNIGRVFQERGYETAFIYGGFGYFDNMNAFFAGNGWQVADRYLMGQDEISFANVWGVCDEDLYQVALKRAGAAHAEGRNFYQFVLTTSNHRPFTYPEGKVAIAPGQGRRGAVQYTDYALGRFLAEARNKPWFKDTIFVIVADHTAGVAGNTVIPPQRYLIPALIYSPEHIPPRRLDVLCSQIDLPPTILALLGMDYEGTFFGRNVLEMARESGRAYMGTYQLLGLMDNDGLAILAPNQKAAVETLTDGALEDERRAHLIRRAIAAYQTASDFFADGRLKNSYLSGLID
jgi:phosphoglycerol transferase MdoB-like AlkP superfamily enzyme